GFPGPLRNVTGIWAEEVDSLYDSDKNALVFSPNGSSGPAGEYTVNTFCELIHAETADILASYKSDFYAGRPALTKNCFGSGTAYYIAARTENRFLEDFYSGLIDALGLLKAMDCELPEGVTAQLRTDGERRFVFLMNFSEEEKALDLHGKYTELITGQELSGRISLPSYGVKIMEAF
ncbi:MAG: beta-galactosidase, partial [Gracilibacteraceae bacterium]|nr:beta-galactosidase [Gracilibacteraceae bacterium]